MLRTVQSPASVQGIRHRTPATPESASPPCTPIAPRSIVTSRNPAARYTYQRSQRHSENGGSVVSSASPRRLNRCENSVTDSPAVMATVISIGTKSASGLFRTSEINSAAAVEICVPPSSPSSAFHSSRIVPYRPTTCLNGRYASPNLTMSFRHRNPNSAARTRNDS